MSTQSAETVTGGRYEVRWITSGSETVIASYDDLDSAFDDCVQRWADKNHRRVYAVRDALTQQRWSFRDIQDLQSAK